MVAMKSSTRELIELLRRFNRYSGLDEPPNGTIEVRSMAAKRHRFYRQAWGRKYARDLVSTFSTLI